MGIKLADTLEPMGSFPAVESNNVNIDIKGTSKSIQQAYEDGDLSGSTIQVDTLPIASADELGKIYQYTGADDNTYKNAHFYRCDYNEENTEYVWTEIVYGSTIQAGDGIDITDDTISVVDRLVETDTMPTASVSLLDATRLFVGTTTSDFIKGGTYQCQSDGEGGYKWVLISTSNLQAGDGIDITDDTISVKDHLEEIDELPTPTAELLDKKKCYLLRSEQAGFVRGSVYHVGGSEEQLVNGGTVVRVSEGSLDDYEKYFDISGSHSDYNKKYTPKSNMIVLCKNFSPLTNYKEVAYFIAETQALRVHYADGSNDETFNYGADKLYIKALVDLAWIPSGTNLDFDSDNFDVANDTVSLKDGYKKIFTGTHAEWDELTLDEKKSYDEADFTDDIASGFSVIDDAVIEGSKNPVTSSAVYNAMNSIETLSPTFASHVKGSATKIGRLVIVTIETESGFSAQSYDDLVSGLPPCAKYTYSTITKLDGSAPKNIYITGNGTSIDSTEAMSGELYRGQLIYICN